MLLTPGSVRSEVGRLESVLLHRPGLELRRLTPSNKDELLFDELLWVDHAQREHDAFADVLRASGAEVLYLESLLSDVLSDEELASAVIKQQVTEHDCGPVAVAAVHDYLRSLSVAELAGRLIGGVSINDVGSVGGLVEAATPGAEMFLHPLPNAVFMRDSSAWIGEGVVLSPMNRLVRRRETALLRLVYQQHPRFADAHIWFGSRDVEYYPATFEGGDLLVVGDRGLAVGLSERTSPAGVEALAGHLFAADVVDRILAVDLPKVRSAMHLDTVVTQVDRDAFITYPSMMSSVRTFEVTRSRAGIDVRAGDSLREGLAWAMGMDAVRMIEPALGSAQAEREQWNDANNTLALAPGVVVAYERNVATNEILSSAGVEVRTIPSYELPRGRGGPRCMSCPVRREAL